MEQIARGDVVQGLDRQNRIEEGIGRWFQVSGMPRFQSAHDLPERQLPHLVPVASEEFVDQIRLEHLVEDDDRMAAIGPELISAQAPQVSERIGVTFPDENPSRPLLASKQRTSVPRSTTPGYCYTNGGNQIGQIINATGPHIVALVVSVLNVTLVLAQERGRTDTTLSDQEDIEVKLRRARHGGRGWRPLCGSCHTRYNDRMTMLNIMIV